MAGSSDRRLIVVPAAGRSVRYRAAGFTTPKPLIRFGWRGRRLTMLEHALGALAETGDVVVVHREEHAEAFDRTLPNYMMRLAVPSTSGQADSVLQALNRAEGAYSEVIVVNSDAGFLYPLDTLPLQGVQFSSASLVFPGCGDTAYSYVQSYPLIRRAVEKNPVSAWALAGAYYFSSAGRLRAALEAQQGARESYAGEFFLSGVYAYLPGQHLAVAMLREQLCGWGTPVDLARDTAVYEMEPAEHALLEGCRAGS